MTQSEGAEAGHLDEGRWLPMFPLGTVLFPKAAMPLHVFEPRYRQMTLECLQGSREFGVVLISRGSEVGGGDQRFAIGTIAHIEIASPFEDGRYTLVCEGTRRVAVKEWLPDAPYPNAIVEELPISLEEVSSECVARAERAVRRSRALLSELGEAPAISELSLADDPEPASWQLCAVAPLNPLDAQRVLEIDGVTSRLESLSELCDSLADDLTHLLGGSGED